METDANDAQSALESIATAQARSAEIATSTPWYAPWYGLTTGAFPLAFGLMAQDSSATSIVIIFATASLALLYTTYRRVTGVWPSSVGFAPLFVAAAVVLLGASIAAYLLAPTIGLGGLIAIAAATAVVMALLSRRFDTAYAKKYGAR